MARAGVMVSEDFLAELLLQAQSQSAAISKLASQIVNGTLGCDLVTIPAEGYLTREWAVPFGTVMVAHHGPSQASSLIQAGGPLGVSAPVGGPTTGALDPGDRSVFALTGHQWTLWGTPGDKFTVQTLTGPVQPAYATKTGAGAGTGTGSGTSTVVFTRFASAGPAGVTAPGTYNIVAGRQSYTIAVNVASSTASPTFNGVALPTGTVLTMTAPAGKTLPAAVLVTVAGDDVMVSEVV